MGNPRHKTRIEVTNETTFSAVRRAFDDAYNAASLNFASATNVGGGWLNGARAEGWNRGNFCVLDTTNRCLYGRTKYRGGYKWL